MPITSARGECRNACLILTYSCRQKPYVEASVQKGVDMSDPLMEAVYRYTNAQKGSGPFATAIDGLTILRSNREKRPNHLILKPALCITPSRAPSGRPSETSGLNTTQAKRWW